MAEGPAASHFERVVSAADGYDWTSDPENWGSEVLNTALVYLVTGDDSYLTKAKDGLLQSLDHYDAQLAAGQAVSWYSSSRICALAAYDWLFNDLSPTERTEIIGRLMRHVHDVQPDVTDGVSGRNNSDHTSGFYGVSNLPWYAGVAGFGDGVDDSLAEQLLLQGLESYVAFHEHRQACAGDDGGSASGTMGYAWGAYPWADFNFLHTYRSATGDDLSAHWSHLALFPGVVHYNWLPGDHEFGFGDTSHRDNTLSFWSGRLHLLQLTHFFADVAPEMAAFSWWMRHQVDDDPYAHLSVSRWGVIPFLLTGLTTPPTPAPPEALPLARHYEALGQVLLRSGSGADDTYAMFVGGGFVTTHRHFDANHFAIYHRGSLALDTGTRLGEGSAETIEHMSEYYARTIGHNAMLVYDPNEAFDGHYWGYSFDDNDGGQDARDTQVVAFESTDRYAYVAGDATGCYKPSKATEVVRQFVFLPPSHFVVFDRVTATSAQFTKHWLLHTATEPLVVSADVFRADQDQGRIFVQTVLPAGAQHTTIGGAGHEFDVFGTNYSFSTYAQEMTDLMGRYRVEVTPTAPAETDHFLHLLQVGDLGLGAMTPGTLVEDGTRAGVRFDHQGLTFEVLFDRTSAIGGHVTIEEGQNVLVDQELIQTVQPQSGFPG
ncbi:MAG: hypothetical protein DRI90_14340 [Deltaproteobacteria bacterium]|nr:MAG: hypothetical protein DRI90_14340 [Deltaproteobacteria bacterium]